MPPILRLENVTHKYQPENSSPVEALHGVSLAVEPGDYVVILGHNGSGKSTLAKHLNALLLPTTGEVWVKQWNTKNAAHLRNIRSSVGMVFQTPDNQIVATIVEEDVAFGPENLGVPRDEIIRRVDWALERVDMLPFRQRPPHFLSGGQKQRICIAGMIAMKPEVLVLDESTAMLDPLGRREVLDVVRRLNKEEGVTIIAITHFMEEAVEADRVLVMEAGRIALQGTPREVFGQVERLRELQMNVPQVTQLAVALSESVPGFPRDVLTVGELVAAVWGLPSPPTRSSTVPKGAASDSAFSREEQRSGRAEGPVIIDIKDLTHYYMRGTPLEVKAIEGVTLDVRRGEVLGIIGHTGSGKSTVIQHFNGLLRPHAGAVTVFGQDMRAADVNVRDIRRRVGLVFQQPEAQLFEQYVGDDVAYGPRNLKLSREEVRARVQRAMEAVGLGFDEFKDRLTFALSGGQMRRIALAGVLALEPEVLVLDEPTSGLDPLGREQIMRFILALRDQGVTLVIVSHNMEELARYCDRLGVISEGRTVMIGSPAEVFGQPEKLRELGLGVPAVTDVMNQLQHAGGVGEVGAVLTIQHALKILIEAIGASKAPRVER